MAGPVDGVPPLRSDRGRRQVSEAEVVERQLVELHAYDPVTVILAVTDIGDLDIRHVDRHIEEEAIERVERHVLLTAVARKRTQVGERVAE